MPSVYAHHRFGTRLLPTFPTQVQKTVRRFSQLFEMGLYGPDIFYYASVFGGEEGAFLGIPYHEQKGKDFFRRVCKRLQQSPSEAALAYLYGVLCHYCLDSACHGYILESAAWGTLEHARIETEFDRYLLELDGKVPAHSQDLSGSIRLSAGESATVALFYPAAKPRKIRQCVRNMAAFHRRTATASGLGRKLLKMSLSLFGKGFPGLLMSETADPSCVFTSEALMQLYQQAEQKLPVLLEQLQAHMRSQAPLEEDFDPKFCD